MSLIEPTEIVLDKPRKLLINHLALYRAEAEINKLRFAKPEDYASIDALMVDGFNHLFRARGMLPMDLLLCMLWAGLVYDDPKKPRLTIEQVAGLLDGAQVNRAEISGTVWGAYFKVAGKNLRVMSDGEAGDDAEKKSQDPPTGPDSGALHELN